MIALSACASKEEKKARRENAFDITGTYNTSKSQGSEVNMTFEIQQESSRSDIVIYLKRNNEMSAREKQFLQNQGLDALKVQQHFEGTLVLGRGYNKGDLDGGENVSKDFGESSEFFICSDGYRYNSEYVVKYCLSGTQKKSEKYMKGGLILSWTRQREIKDKDGKPISTEVSTNQTVLNYQTDVSSNFYRQYLGNWSGQVYSFDSSLNSSPMTHLSLRETPQGEINVQFENQNHMDFKSQSFSYDKNQSSMDIVELANREYPAIHTTYRAVNGQKLILYAQIWSLGDLTGSIVMDDGVSETELATVRFKKD